jgi:tetratricopeptide (TPR) repeat protein
MSTEIADPHAIPETEADCAAYQQAADAAWDGGDSDRAWALYHSLFQSRCANNVERSHTAYRLALIAINAGDHDQAWTFIVYSHEPGTDDLRRALDNSTRHDPEPDPDTPPRTVEDTDHWWAAAIAASEAGNWELCRRFFASIAASTCNPPNTIAKAEYAIANATMRLGDQATARLWYERALPNLDDPEMIALARQNLAELGVVERDDKAGPAANQVAHGVSAYELGDLAAAGQALQVALHLDGPAEVKGRAHFYLGSMDYQNRRYAEARNHLEAAAANAPAQERDWATQMLGWHWDETAVR